MEDTGNLMQRTARTPEVLDYLRDLGARTLNLLGLLDNEPEAEVYVDDARAPRGVLAKHKRFWYLHTEDDGFAELACRELARRGGYQGFSGVWRPLAERLKARFPMVWDAPCELYLLPDGNPRRELAARAAEPLVPADAELVDAHYAYRNDQSLEKIRSAIRHRPSSCIRVDGQPVCWLLVHEDDSLGIMYTLEAHRRKGLAVDVTVDLLAKQLERGRTPFLQIRDDNALSPGLARKCGLVPAGFCDWFGLMVTPSAELQEGGARFRSLLVAAQDGQPVATACLFRFLYPMPAEDPAANPVVELARAAWEAAPALPVPDRLRDRLRVLGEGDRPVAALLPGEEESFALVWLADREPALLQRVLARARALDLGLAFVHAEGDFRGFLEAQGFSLAYDVCPSPLAQAALSTSGGR
jgi:hypothetical protein